MAAPQGIQDPEKGKEGEYKIGNIERVCKVCSRELNDLSPQIY
jgi:hypothetical protein